MKKYVDLHIHTTTSDGTLTPEELIIELKKNHIDTFAITDHDATDSISKTITLAKANHLNFIPGIELSTTYFDKEIHLLVYGIDPNCPLLKELIIHNRGIRNRQSLQIIERASLDVGNVSLEDYLIYERNPKNGGWKSENYLRARGAIESLNDFFDFANQVPPMIFPSPLELIPKLKEKGYQIILAHPPAYFNGQLLQDSFLDPLVDAGLDGIECFSPYYKSPFEKDHYLNYCREKNLLITAGSDYHGDFIPSRKLGNPAVTLAEIAFPLNFI